MTEYSIGSYFENISIVSVIPLIILCLIGFVLVHVIKLMRMYLVVIEQKIPFDRFIPAYLRTTLANLIIPFKLGEVYRVGVFSRITGSINIGFFSVLIDRFFDTLALLIIILPYQLFGGKGVGTPVIFLAIFLLVVIFTYGMFPSTYRYLNRYIITSRTSKRSMAVLRGLEKINGWYLYVEKLVSGRYGLMFLLSIGAWLLELLEILGIAKIFNIEFKLADFSKYISSILSTQSSLINRMYTLYSILIIAIACVIFTVRYLIRRKKHKQ